MIGTRLGPYLLEKELGSGGMGSVYLARATEDAAGVKDGARVAVKVVHPHLLERAGFFKRFLREAEIGRSVRHESVVRTLDVDAIAVEGKSVHYMVMEYVEGKTLRGLLGELRTVPETLLREVARQVASGLAAIHAAGIVHRDLKPENVLITPEHQVKIMDLGVARLMEESVALTREGQFAGSLLYAAPEQFGNAVEVGPAADLYSVGVMLYELACGENPFQRDGAVAVMTAHLKERPVRLADRHAEVSPFFSEVVDTLLRKDPHGRFASAKAFLDLLEDGEKSTWWGERQKALLKEEGHLPKIPVRRETALFGRAGDLAILREAWGRARAGQGGTILLEGEAGIGKTRLVDAFLQDFRGEDAHVLYGSYPPSGGLGGLSESVIGRFGAAGLEGALRPYLTVTPALVPAFAALLKHEPPPAGAEPLRGDSFHAVFVHLLRGLAAERPLVWVLEDLHFAPRESRDVVLSLARAASSHRTLLVVTARPGLSDEEQANFGKVESLRRVPLARLGAREVMDLLRDAFRSSTLAEKLGGKIAWKSDGVPYFILEMLRGLKEGKFIRQGPDGSFVQSQVVSDIEVPSTVKELVAARLGGLSKRERDLLDVGAVQGLVFDPGLVAAVLEEKKIRVLQDLAEVERRTGLIRGEAGGCRFDQNQIQEVLYQALMPDLRTEYHALLAEAYAEREGVEPGTASGEASCLLAEHHLRGSRPRKALPFLDACLDLLERQDRGDRILELTGLALGIPGLLTPSRRVEILLRKATRLNLQGRRDEEERALAEAMEGAKGLEDAGLRAKVAFSLGQHAYALAQYGEALARLEEAAALAARAGDGALEMRAIRGLGNVAYMKGEGDAADREWKRSLEIARRIGDRDGEAAGTLNLGLNGVNAGDFAEAEELVRRGMALAREAGNRRWEGNAHHYLSGIAEARGALADALGNARRALDLHRAAGFRLGEDQALGTIAGLLLACGRIEEASAVEAERAALERESRGSLYPDSALWFSANLAQGKGETAEAERLLRKALEAAREGGAEVVVRGTLLRLAGLLAEAGRAAEAMTLLNEAEALPAAGGEEAARVEPALLRAMAGGPVEEALSALAAAEPRLGWRSGMSARWRLWRVTRDPAHLAEAWRLLRHLRDHAPEEYRGTLMERVPLHRDIAAAAAEAGL